MVVKTRAREVGCRWRTPGSESPRWPRCNPATTKQIHPEWAEQGHEYYRAVWVECAELLDHFGWKWWKRHAVDRDQVVLEVVDIWHFGLSELIRAGEVNKALAKRLQESLAEPTRVDFRLAVEELARSSLALRGFDIDAFAGVMRALPLTFDELYETYVAKNVSERVPPSQRLWVRRVSQGLGRARGQPALK